MRKGDIKESWIPVSPIAVASKHAMLVASFRHS